DPVITEKVMDALDSVIQELDTSGTLEATTCKQIRHLIEAKAEMPPDALVAHKSRIKALVYERISGLLPMQDYADQPATAPSPSQGQPSQSVRGTGSLEDEGPELGD
ncbi:unnamed protein product, partial [Effrenium voratum]